MPWTMIAVSIGAQYINNQLASKKNEELQLRQREFQKATQQKDFARMRRLQMESAQLQLEIDAEIHKQKLDDIQANYDEASQNISTDIAIEKWPLKVLPFVMRGQSFGTLFNGSQSIALHCIFTPSNCDNFNEAVYTDIDMHLERICNQNWSSLSTHPIAYYGGAWRRHPFDLDHVDLLKTQITQVPTVVITPYFNPKSFCFKVKLWGMGKDADIRLDIPKDLFSYSYTKGMNYSPIDDYPKGDLIERTVEELVQYLTSLIGYVSDHYYFSLYNTPPLFLTYNNGNLNESMCLPYSLKTEIREWFKAVYNKRLGSWTKSEMLNLRDCIDYELFDWSDLPTLLQLLDLIRNADDGDLLEEHEVIKRSIDNILERNSLTSKYIVDKYPYLTLDEFCKNIVSSLTSKKDNKQILYLEFCKKERVVSVYYESSAVQIGEKKHYQRYNYNIDCLLVPAELAQQKVKRIKINDLEKFGSSVANQCNHNIFHRRLSLNDIISEAQDYPSPVHKCELLRGDQLEDKIGNVTDWHKQHLIHATIRCNDSIRTTIFYYDELEDKLNQMFEDGNNLILE